MTLITINHGRRRRHIVVVVVGRHSGILYTRDTDQRPAIMNDMEEKKEGDDDQSLRRVAPAVPTLPAGKGDVAVTDTNASSDDGANGNADDDEGVTKIQATAIPTIAATTNKVEPSKQASSTSASSTTLSLSTLSSPLRDAFNIAKQRSTEAAKQLIFPIDTFIAPKDSSEESSSQSHCSSRSDYSSYSGGGDHSHSSDGSDASVVGGDDGRSSKASNASAMGGTKNIMDASRNNDDKATSKNNHHHHNNSTGGSSTSHGKAVAETTTASIATPASTLTPTRLMVAAEATNSVITAAVGRYRRLKEASSSPLPPMSKKVGEVLVVGGADRVGGLRNFQLEEIIINDEKKQPGLNASNAVASRRRLLPPSMPLSSKVSVE